MSGDLQQSLEAAIQKHRIPGAAMALHSHGRTDYAAAGIINVKTGIACTPDAVFQIGSTTKVFTATLMMRLAGEGMIALDAPVTRYLPHLRIAGETAPDALTVRSLLDYTSGIEADLWQDFGPDPRALAEYVDACADLRFVHPPGRFRSYNTTAYCIAGRLIEVMTGRHFNTALQDLLLIPLGIENFHFYDEKAALLRTAVGHIPAHDETPPRLHQHLRMPHVLSAAGSSLSLDIEGLLGFGLFHMRAGALTRGEQFIPADLLAAMQHADRTKPPAASHLATGWAQIPATGPAGAVHFYAASGATMGQNSLLAIAPEANIAVALLSNVDGGCDKLFHEIGLPLFDSIAGVTVQAGESASDPADQSVPASLEAFAGHYFNSAEITVELDDGTLRMTSTHQGFGSGEPMTSAATLVPVGADRFGIIPAGATEPAGALSFLSLGEENQSVTHIHAQNRLFKRCHP